MQWFGLVLLPAVEALQTASVPLGPSSGSAVVAGDRPFFVRVGFRVSLKLHILVLHCM